MVTLKEKVKKTIDTLNPQQLLELSRLLKLFTTHKKKITEKKIKLKSFSCGGKIMDFTRADAYENHI